MNRMILSETDDPPAKATIVIGRVAFAVSAQDLAAIMTRLECSKSTLCLLLVDAGAGEPEASAPVRSFAEPPEEPPGAGWVADSYEKRLAPLSRLSERQRSVLQLIATGATTREIARSLVISGRTVERHIADLYAKIGARNRAEATAYAARQHLI